MDLAVELQKIYDNEINIEIGWIWDGGIEVRLGDRMNGFLTEENLKSVSDIIPWLREAIAHFYPQSGYAASLDAEFRTRAARRVFSPRTPVQGLSVRIAALHTLHPVWMN
jgi:hypothetical protein